MPSRIDMPDPDPSPTPADPLSAAALIRRGRASGTVAVALTRRAEPDPELAAPPADTVPPTGLSSVVRAIERFRDVHRTPAG